MHVSKDGDKQASRLDNFLMIWLVVEERGGMRQDCHDERRSWRL